MDEKKFWTNMNNLCSVSAFPIVPYVPEGFDEKRTLKSEVFSPFMSCSRITHVQTAPFVTLLINYSAGGG